MAIVGLQPLSLDSRPLVMDYLRRYPPRVSELTFTNLYVWRKARPVWYAEFQGRLVFLVPGPAPSGGYLMMGDPVGDFLSADVLRSAVPDLRGMARVTEESASAWEREGWRIEPDDDNADYVYRVSDLAELKGEKYHKKRNLVVKKFRATVALAESEAMAATSADPVPDPRECDRQRNATGSRP
jgi:hypothetical protein